MGTDETKNGGQVYFEGQPFEGIKEAEFVPELMDNAPEGPLKAADNVELTLTLTLTPEQIEAMKQAIEEMGRKIRELAEWIGEAFRKAAAAVTQTANSFMDRMLYEASDNPQWWHLYKHAKKYRTRKKYRRLLMEQLISKLETAATTKEENP